MDERDGEIIMNAVDWKKRMRERLQEVLGVEGDLSLDKLDKTRDILVALKRLKLNKDEDTISFKVPERFKCPLSKNLMRDPVLLSTGLVEFPLFILIVYLELTYDFQLVWNCECVNYGYVCQCMGVFMFFVWLLEGEIFGIALCIYGLVLCCLSSVFCNIHI